MVWNARRVRTVADHYGEAGRQQVTRSLGAGVVAVLGVLLFWSGVFGAGALVSTYSAREDYISSLAGRGSSMALVGVVALLASATAHVATSWAVLVAWRSRVCALCVFGAAVATGVVAVFRRSCPDGPAGCAREGTPTDWVDVVHRAGVGGYELFALAAMLTLAVGSVRRTSPWPQWLGLTSFVFAMGSMILLGQIRGDHVGLWQRLWLANNLAWLLMVAAAATWWVEPPTRRSGRVQRSQAQGRVSRRH